MWVILRGVERSWVVCRGEDLTSGEKTRIVVGRFSLSGPVSKYDVCILFNLGTTFSVDYRWNGLNRPVVDNDKSVCKPAEL